MIYYAFILLILNIYQLIHTMPLKNNEKRLIQYDFNSNEYLLISTSTRIYCVKANMKETINYENTNINGLKRTTNSMNDGVEIIYEELNSTNSWITDLYYNRVDNIIYANIYDSSTLKSDIISLTYDSDTGKWLKNVLFHSQSNCLGITYNEVYKELYWTSGQTIMAGLLAVPTKPTRVLFNLTSSVKKLLYLKYDRQNEAIYVSSLNQVHVCFLTQNTLKECEVLMSHLHSARGLHLDSFNNYLYVADHKKKEIQKIKLGENLREQFDNKTWVSESSTQIALDSNIVSNFGDVFYLCLHKSTLLWTEFSGKVKSTNINSLASNYEVLFTTNEYVYAVTVFDNSAYEPNYINEDFSMEQSISKTDVDDYADLAGVANVQKTETTQRTIPTISTTTTTTTIKTTTESTTTTITTTTKTTSTTTTTTTNVIVEETVKPIVFEINTSTALVEAELVSSNSEKLFNAVESESLKDIEPVEEISSTSVANAQINLNKQKIVKQNDIETDLSSNNRLINSKNDSEFNLTKSPFLIALYIISSLLGLSIIVNLAFIYITKMRRNSGRLVINADSDDLSEQQNLRNEIADMN